MRAQWLRAEDGPSHLNDFPLSFRASEARRNLGQSAALLGTPTRLNPVGPSPPYGLAQDDMGVAFPAERG